MSSTGRVPGVPPESPKHGEDRAISVKYEGLLRDEVLFQPKSPLHVESAPPSLQTALTVRLVIDCTSSPSHPVEPKDRSRCDSCREFFQRNQKISCRSEAYPRP